MSVPGAERTAPQQADGQAAPRPESDDDILIRVENVVKHFPVKSVGFTRRTVGQVHAVDDVSLTIPRGKTVGLVGETGCGKSTLARCVAALIPVTSGKVLFEGNDISRLSRRQMQPYRREIQMIFQDPYGSLNPRQRVGSIIGEPFAIHRMASGGERKRRVQELMERVGLNPEHYNRFPAEFSGGQRQRIGVARALALRPKLIICDEPVSALDVSIQAQVLNLLADLQDEFGLTYLFIAHDLEVVRHVSHAVSVMYLGRLAEAGPRTPCTKRRAIRTPLRCFPPRRPLTRTPRPAGSGSSWSGMCPRPSIHPRAAGFIRAAPRPSRCAQRRSRNWRSRPVIRPRT